MWTVENAQQAELANEFIYVTPSQSTNISILDANDLWLLNPKIIFQTGYRIAGTAEDITNVLSLQNISQNNIHDVLNSAITFDNYKNTAADLYTNEILNIKLYRRSIVKSNILSPGIKLFDIIASLNPEILTVNIPTKNNKSTSVQSTTKSKRGKSLFDKLNDLPAGKVLDVSDLKPDGTGVKTVNKPTSRSKKISSPSLAIISSNFNNYLLAINMIPGGEIKYSDDVLYVQHLFAESGLSINRLITSNSANSHVNTLPDVVPPDPPTNYTLIQSQGDFERSFAYPRFLTKKDRERIQQQKSSQ